MDSLHKKTFVNLVFVRLLSLVAVSVLLFCSNAAAQEKSELHKQLTSAWRHFYKGKLQDAAGVLKPLIESRHEDIRMEASHCLARVYWREGSERGKMEANKIWNRIETKSTAFAHQDRMAIARSLRLADAGKLNEAERILDPLLGKQHQSTATAEAALVYADVLIRLKNFKRAAMAAGFAEGFLKSKAGIELGDRINPFVEASRAMQKKVKAASRPKPAPKRPKTPKPKDPAAELFKKAESLRANKQYTQAMFVYHQIMEHYKDSPFAPRSELHTGHCHLGMNRIDSAIGAWDQFVARKPSGPWRGQAYVELIDTALAYKFDPDQADAFAENANKELDGSGKDSSWQRVTGDLHLRFGILALTKNEGEKAAEHLNTALRHISKPSRRMQDSMKRLLHAAKKQGTALPKDVSGEATTEKQEEQLARSVRLLSVATMLCLLDKNGCAMELAGNLAVKARGFTAAQKSYALFVYGLARRRVPEKSGQANTRAMAALKKSLAMYPGGSWHDETLYHAAMTIMVEANQKYGPQPTARSWGGKDPSAEELIKQEKKRNERQDNFIKARRSSLGYWERIVKNYPESPRLPEAGFNVGLLLWESRQNKRASAEFQAVIDKAPDSAVIGECWLMLGLYAIEYEVQLKKAWNCFGNLDAWINKRYGNEETAPAADTSRLKSPLWVLDATQPGGVLSRARRRELLTSEELRWYHREKWYIGTRKSQCAKYMGFLLFVVGRYEEAKKMYANILKFDPDVAASMSKGEFNDYSRLVKACDMKCFCASPEEIRVYANRQQLLALYLMDFYYCTERWAKAESLARRMLAGDFGRLNQKQKAYPQVMIGNCVYWTRGRALAAAEYQKAFGGKLTNLQGEVSPAVDRAAFCAGNVASQSFDPRVRDWGLDILKTLSYSGRRNRWVYQAILGYSRELIVHSDKEIEVKEGIKLLETFPQDSDGCDQLAKLCVEDYKLMRKNRIEKQRKASRQKGDKQ